MSDFWKDLLLQVIELLFIIVMPMILLLARAAVKKLEKKLDIDLDEKQEAQLDQVLTQGIAYAREQSRSALKTEKKALTGADKKTLALDYVTSAVKESGIAERSAEVIERRLAARLNMERHVSDQDIPTRKTK